MEKLVLAEFKFELPDTAMAVLQEIAGLAQESGFQRLALVGGAVRDGLRHQFGQCTDASLEIPDLDLVVEGSAIALAQMLSERLEQDRLTHMQIHQAFDTVGLVVDGVRLDLATARQESYPIAAENPQVSAGSLETDLARRDFTVNAMAVELAEARLLDLHAGCDALKSRQLFLLHPKSVEDDPTRIIRAARYAARLEFELAPATLDQIRRTLLSWPWSWCLDQAPELAPPALASRLGMELNLLMQHEPWFKALTNLQRWGALSLLDDQLQADHLWPCRLRWAAHLGIPRILALVLGAASPLAVAARLQLSHQQQGMLKESLVLQQFLAGSDVAEGWPDWTPARWCEALEQMCWRPEAVALTICTGVPMWHKLFRWFYRWRHVCPQQSAQQLMAEGWRPGPDLGAELRRQRLEQVNLLEDKSG